ncbi:L-gulonolactone/D-arabinono-1,4-lactone oxidase [Calocera cornea HHB12733]|uniref:D-arabinono-1,4-lactone oxidase n=1 Tax=Calocera cornea HHB12733 TaxID=1353952 RepID=A0A165D5R3_9BASI|nr:L-gulonolactone/D-arabinono-1,4-lactone oxidase [Calocera cornea HHB12733]
MATPTTPAPPAALGAYTTSGLYTALEPTREDRLRRSFLPLFRQYRRTEWFQNWAETFRCAPQAVFVPRTVEQCQMIVELAKREGKAIRATGARHSPSDLWCTTGWMVRMNSMDKVLEIDTEKKTVTAQAGIILHALNKALHGHGLALRNIGSISDQSLAGVITTATHGTGWAYQCMSGDVLQLTLLLASGEIVTCSRGERQDLFLASLCGLGATGLILSAKVQLEPSFRLRESREKRPFPDVVRDLDSLAGRSEHTRVWWNPQADTAMVMLANRTYEVPSPAKGSFFWGTVMGHWVVEFLLFVSLAIPSITPGIGRLAASLDAASAVVVDDSYNIFNLDCLFKQYTTEWALPYENAAATLTELRAFLQAQEKDPKGLRAHYPIEVRFSAPDDIWLSPSYGRQTVWIGIVMYKPYGYDVPWRKWFDAFEALMLRQGGRPHWAKLHPLTPSELSAMYPKFGAFKKVLEDVDPEGVFRNEYVKRHVFGELGGNEPEAFSRRVAR